MCVFFHTGRRSVLYLSRYEMKVYLYDCFHERVPVSISRLFLFS